MLGLYILEDNVVEMNGLTDAITGEYINDATVTFSLKDASDNVVSSLSGVSMAYVTDSNGIYRGTIPDTADISDGRIYYVEITAVAGDRNGFRRIKCEGLYRETT